MRLPALVKINARCRGPIESRKINSAYRDIDSNLQQIRNQLTAQNTDGGVLRDKIFKEYLETTHQRTNEAIQRVKSLRGGDL